DQQRERFVPQTRFDFIDSLHRAQVEWVRRQTIERVGRHAQHLPGLNLLGGILDQRSFGRYGINFQDFRAHSSPFPIAGVNVAGVDVVGVNLVGSNNEMYHTASFGRSPARYSYYPDRILSLEPNP